MTLYRTKDGLVLNTETGVIQSVGSFEDLKAWRDTLPLLYPPAQVEAPAPAAVLAPTPAARVEPSLRAVDASSAPAPVKARPYDLLEADCLAHAAAGDKIEYCGGWSEIWYPATLVSRGDDWVVTTGQGLEVALAGGRAPAVRWPGGGKLEPWMRILKPGDEFETNTQHGWSVAELLRVEQNSLAGLCGLRLRWAYGDNPGETWAAFTDCRPHVVPSFKGPESYPEWAQALKKGEPFFANGEVAIFVEHRCGQHDRLGLHYEKPDEEPATVRWIDVRACQPYPKSVATALPPRTVPKTAADVAENTLPHVEEIAALKRRVSELETALFAIAQTADAVKP